MKIILRSLFAFLIMCFTVSFIMCFTVSAQVVDRDHAIEIHDAAWTYWETSDDWAIDVNDWWGTGTPTGEEAFQDMIDCIDAEPDPERADYAEFCRDNWGDDYSVAAVLAAASIYDMGFELNKPVEDFDMEAFQDALTLFTDAAGDMEAAVTMFQQWQYDACWPGQPAWPADHPTWTPPPPPMGGNGG